jgi:hypothetical protein
MVEKRIFVIALSNHHFRDICKEHNFDVREVRFVPFYGNGYRKLIGLSNAIIYRRKGWMNYRLNKVLKSLPESCIIKEI